VAGALFVLTTFFPEQSKINSFMSYFLKDKESTFINIAAIFIGIYFAFFGILGSIKPGSLLTNVSEKGLSKLLKFLRRALIAGFVYIFLTLFFSEEHTGILWNCFNIILFLSLIYMLLSAFRFGTYMVFFMYDDTSRLFEDIQNLKEDDYREKEIMLKLEKFLNDYETLIREERANELRELIRKQNNS
jgi:hypothetical protein